LEWDKHHHAKQQLISKSIHSISTARVPWVILQEYDPGEPVPERYQEGKTNLDLLEQEMVIGSGISWEWTYANLINNIILNECTYR